MSVSHMSCCALVFVFINSVCPGPVSMIDMLVYLNLESQITINSLNMFPVCTCKPSIQIRDCIMLQMFILLC